MLAPTARLRALRLAIGLVWRSDRRLFVANAVLVVLQGAVPLAVLALTRDLIDAVAAAAAGRAADGRVAFLIALTAGTALVGAVLQSLAAYANEAQALAVTDHVQDVLHAKSVEIDLGYYESGRHAETLHRAQREAAHRPTRIVGELLRIGQHGAALAAMALLLTSVHWGAFVALVAATTPGVVLRLVHAGRLYGWQRGRTAAEREAGYLGWVLTDAEHAREVRLLGLGPVLRDRYRGVRAMLRRERLTFARRRAAADLVTSAASTAAVFLILLFLAQRVTDARMSIGALVMAFAAFQRAQAALRELGGAAAGLYEDTLFLEHLREFLALAPAVPDPVRPRPLPRPWRDGVRVESLGFRYPGAARAVLTDVSIEVRPGEVVALVGENGSGKTTLVKLLCRLYDPCAGRITIDGVDLRELDGAALRRRVGVLPQDFVHFQLTARDNVAFGDVCAPVDDARLRGAVRVAGAGPLVRRLPRGLDTVLGAWFPGGTELSGGEWQRVALARLAARDADLVVLDEPTSAIDARGEAEIVARFRRLVRGRAAIVISHRLATVRQADRIYVLDGGRVIESGGHAELVRRGGVYAGLFELQASAYR